MKDYVAGFAFSPDGRRVCLVRKNRPDWQRGRLNAVGGKVEPGESPDAAMVREFQEETGARTAEADWDLAVVLSGEGFRVRFYRAFLDLSACRTVEDEEILVAETLPVPADALPNLAWLIPLLLDGVAFPIEVLDARPSLLADVHAA